MNTTVGPTGAPEAPRHRPRRRANENRVPGPGRPGGPGRPTPARAGEARRPAPRPGGRQAPSREKPAEKKSPPVSARSDGFLHPVGERRLPPPGPRLRPARRPLLLRRRGRPRDRHLPAAPRPADRAGHASASTSTSTSRPTSAAARPSSRTPTSTSSYSPKLRRARGQVQAAQWASSACSRPPRSPSSSAPSRPPSCRTATWASSSTASSPAGVVAYAAGVFDGAPDGGSVDTDLNDGKDLGGPGLPLALQEGQVRAQGPGLRDRRHHRQADGPAAGLPLRRAGQHRHHRSPGSPADGTRTRYSPQLSFYSGPFGLLAEYAQSDVARSRRPTAAATSLEAKAWQTTATLALTGDKAAYAGVRPRSRSIPRRASGAPSSWPRASTASSSAARASTPASSIPPSPCARPSPGRWASTGRSTAT